MIGSHLVEYLLANGARSVCVADDLSSGRKEWVHPDARSIQVDLRDYDDALWSVNGQDVVFSLAAAHGGRAFVDTHALECWQNAEIDATVFRACADSNNVQKVVYMSSACAYDTSLQQDPNVDFKLSESMIDYNKPIKADNAYGEQKYYSERMLQAYSKHFDYAVVRGFTVYGPRVSMTHFIGAAIARTMVQQDPLFVFGTGDQKRNWTFVKDTARGIALAAEFLKNDVVNIGTEEVNTPHTAYEHLWDILGFKPTQVTYSPGQLTGPANRIADATKAKEVLGWQPEYTFRQGLEETVEWFQKTHSVEELKQDFEAKLYER